MVEKNVWGRLCCQGASTTPSLSIAQPELFSGQDNSLMRLCFYVAGPQPQQAALLHPELVSPLPLEWDTV